MKFTESREGGARTVRSVITLGDLEPMLAGGEMIVHESLCLEGARRRLKGLTEHEKYTQRAAETDLCSN